MGVSNVSRSDRLARVAIGLVFLYLGSADLVPGWLGVEFIALGVFALVTGVTGWCPLYAMSGRRTRPRVSR